MSTVAIQMPSARNDALASSKEAANSSPTNLASNAGVSNSAGSPRMKQIKSVPIVQPESEQASPLKAGQKSIDEASPQLVSKKGFFQRHEWLATLVSILAGVAVVAAVVALLFATAPASLVLMAPIMGVLSIPAGILVGKIVYDKLVEPLPPMFKDWVKLAPDQMDKIDRQSWRKSGDICEVKAFLDRCSTIAGVESRNAGVNVSGIVGQFVVEELSRSQAPIVAGRPRHQFPDLSENSKAHRDLMNLIAYKLNPGGNP